MKQGITEYVCRRSFCASGTGIFFAPQAEGDTAGKGMCAGGLPICRTIRLAWVLEGRACLSGNDAA